MSGAFEAKVGFLELITLDITTVYFKASVFGRLICPSFTPLVNRSLDL